MIGLHTPFRRATPHDSQAIAKISSGDGRITSRSTGEAGVENTIVGEDNGRVFAVLAGSPAEGDAWQVDVLALAPERSFDEFAPRLLAIADALAADEGLATVRLTVDQATDHVLAVLDREGFRSDGAGAALSMSRPVVPQG
jgi:N-acetylglutamate synthase-like GNAT family acetyltransferase